MIAALLGLAGLLAAGGVLATRERRRRRYRDRLHVEPSSRRATRARVRRRWTFRESRRPGIVRWLGRDLRRAGSRLGSFEMLLLMILGAATATALAGAASLSGPWTALAGFAGAALPRAATAWAASRRIAQLDRQLADALDSMTAALQSGVGLRQAMDVVRLHHRPPLSDEFGEMLARIDAGAPPPEVFREHALLLRSGPFDLFAATLAAKWDAGGNLSPMLLSLARRIRDSIRLRRRVLSLTAEARFSAAVLLLMPYALGIFLHLTTPENLRYLFDHPTGRALLQLALALQILGAAWMAWLVRKEDL